MIKSSRNFISPLEEGSIKEFLNYHSPPSGHKLFTVLSHANTQPLQPYHHPPPQSPILLQNEFKFESASKLGSDVKEALWVYFLQCTPLGRVALNLQTCEFQKQIAQEWLQLQ